MRILIAGTFDKFHIGHQFFCWSVFGMSSDLVIIVACDVMVAKRKNRFAINSEFLRWQRVAKEFESFSSVTVRLGRSDGDFLKTIEEEHPDKILLGYDQFFDIETCKKHFPELEIKRFISYNPKIFKSSKF